MKVITGGAMNFLQAVLRTLFYVAVGGVISIVGAAFFFMNWEPDRNQYTIRGIDISHHQGDIDWAQVAAVYTRMRHAGAAGRTRGTPARVMRSGWAAAAAVDRSR